MPLSKQLYRKWRTPTRGAAKVMAPTVAGHCPAPPPAAAALPCSAASAASAAASGADPDSDVLLPTVLACHWRRWCCAVRTLHRPPVMSLLFSIHSLMSQAASMAMAPPNECPVVLIFRTRLPLKRGSVASCFSTLCTCCRHRAGAQQALLVSRLLHIRGSWATVLHMTAMARSDCCDNEAHLARLWLV